jgi:uncharacterized protein (TIGR02246 family)
MMPVLKMSVLGACAMYLASINAQGQESPTGQQLAEERKEHPMTESAVRQRVEEYATAIRDRDLGRLMSLYAPAIVSFDLNPPLRYAGTDNKRQAWQEFFAAYRGQVGYDIHELSVTTDDELAFVHSLNHVTGMQPRGHKADLWVRWTACFQRIDGAWRIVHDHVSVPADLKHGRALLDLKP